MLTGGEPTTREDLPEILRTLKNMGKRAVIFTNGLKLANRNYLKKLKHSGLGAIFFQLDTLDEVKSAAIRGENLLQLKEKAIRNINNEEVPLYFYSLVVRENLEDLREIIKFSLKFPTVKMISFDVLGMFGRCEGGEYVSTSEIVERLCNILKIRKDELFECSRFLNSVDKINLFLSKERRIFTKCFLKCPLLFYKRKLIPISRVFDLKKINHEVELISSRKEAIHFLIKFTGREIFLNFFLNKYFRILVKKFLKNLKYLIKRKYSLANPFFFIDVMIVPSPGNIDSDFYRECNFYAITPWNKGPEPACIVRVKQGSRE